MDDMFVLEIGRREQPPHGESAPPDHRRTGWAGLPVNVTGIADAVSGPFHMYLTWAAWTACGFCETSWEQVRHLCQRFNAAVDRFAPNPVFRFRPEPAAVELEAAFGPCGKGGTCVRLALPGEPAWVTPLFRPDRVVLLDPAGQSLCPWAQCAVVGWHLVGDWGSVSDGWWGRGDDDFHHGRVVRSVFEMPAVGELTAVVTTDPTRSQTTVEASTTRPLFLTLFPPLSPAGEARTTG